jgi:glycosyl transferase family 61
MGRLGIQPGAPIFFALVRTNASVLAWADGRSHSFSIPGTIPALPTPGRPGRGAQEMRLGSLAFSLRIRVTTFISRCLERLYRRKKGSAGRLRSVLSGRAPLKDCVARTLVDSRRLEWPPPRYYADGPDERRYAARLAGEGAGQTEPAGIISARDVDVSLPIGMHLWKGKVLEDSILNPEALMNPKYVFDLETIPLRPKEELAEGVLLTLPWSHNFYHWMIDILPRLLLVDRAEDLRNAPLLVPRSAPGFVRESLALTGYLDRTRFLESGVYRVRRLHFLTRLSNGSDVSPHAVDWLDRKFPPSAPGKKRLYVSRSDARIRYVANEKEIERVLAEFGFETFVPSHHPLAEQIRRFREASVVLGPHGAAFANLAFVAPGSTFVEMFDSSYFSRCFHRLAGIKQLEHGFVLGRPAGLGFIVSPDELAILLKRVLSQKPQEKARSADRPKAQESMLNEG